MAARDRHVLTAAELEAATGASELDLELFAWICRRFDQAVRAEDDLDEDVRELQASNRRYAPIGRIEVRMRELARDAIRGRR